jgi:hypothetical protein
MRVSVGFVFGSEACRLWGLRTSTLGPKRWAGVRSGWSAASCVAALLCLCVFPGVVTAQDAASSSSPSPQKTGGTKSGTTKRPAKAPASNGSAAKTASSRKPHSSSHPTAGQHSKSNAAVVAHASKTKRLSSRRTGKKSAKARGQQKIEPERAQAIQEALIREHYLSGEAAGTWNQASEDAMRKYQADHGWQSKTVPDARALISLGLGPNHDHLLNPESAMTTGPEALHSVSASSTSNPVSHSVDPGTPMNANPPDAPAVAPTHDSSSPQ